MLESGGLFFDGEMWKDPRQLPYNYNPKQIEIKYFWPLTEQIPLDLDYSNAGTPFDASLDKAEQFIVSSGGSGMTLASNLSWTTSVNSDKIETNEITFTVIKKPDIIKRLVYKFLGFKWKVK